MQLDKKEYLSIRNVLQLFEAILFLTTQQLPQQHISKKKELILS